MIREVVGYVARQPWLRKAVVTTPVVRLERRRKVRES